MTDPIKIFTDWYQLASQKEVCHNAMTLSTCSGNVPYSRTVLLKKQEGNEFTFFTNYESPKSSDLEVNPYASLLFFWPKIERQVRIVGRAKKTSREESVEYFDSRPYLSRVASMVSEQSMPMKSYFLFGVKCVNTFWHTKCPEHWGGWIIEAEEIEFLEMKPNRMHIRNNYNLVDGEWNHVMLYP